MQDSKSATITVFGAEITVTFSNCSDEYFECKTQAQLKTAAKARILAILNEISEVQNENALVLIKVS